MYAIPYLRDTSTCKYPVYSACTAEHTQYDTEFMDVYVHVYVYVSTCSTCIEMVIPGRVVCTLHVHRMVHYIHSIHASSSIGIDIGPVVFHSGPTSAHT